MQIHVSPGDEVPLYRQIVHQVVEAVAGGRLLPGEKLPSHRDLAQQLAVAPLTVKQAYDALEAEGLIETRRGLGTFVTRRASAGSRRARTDRLRAALRRLLHEAWLAGRSIDDVHELVDELAAELDAERARAGDEVRADVEPSSTRRRGDDARRASPSGARPRTPTPRTP